MTVKTNIITLLITLVFLLSFKASAEGINNIATHKVAMTIAYNMCIDPKKPICYAASEADKDKCPNCKVWKSGFLGSGAIVALAIDDYKYSYNTGIRIPRSNFLLNDVAKELYGSEYPKTKFGFPVAASVIYENPEKFGWVQVEKNSSKAGALVVWPNFGGVVIKSQEMGTGGLFNDMVLYPSDKRDGVLIVRPVEKLMGEGTPKFIIPKAALESAAEIELKINDTQFMQ